jgi:hypothetical protein
MALENNEFYKPLKFRFLELNNARALLLLRNCYFLKIENRKISAPLPPHCHFSSKTTHFFCKVTHYFFQNHPTLQTHWSWLSKDGISLTAMINSKTTQHFKLTGNGFQNQPSSLSDLESSTAWARQVAEAHIYVLFLIAWSFG